MNKSSILASVLVSLSAAFPVAAQTPARDAAPHASSGDSLSWGILVPASATLARAWEVPRNPMREQPGDTSQEMQRVRRGFALFMNTSALAPSLTGGAMSCNHCHPNGGQRERALPLVGIARAFPENNKRAGRVFTLEDRIVGCFLRSVNATGSRDRKIRTAHENQLARSSINAGTREVKDIAAYLTWLSSGLHIGKEVPWRGHNALPASSLLPLNKLDPGLGKKYFNEWCAICHGREGQGIEFPAYQVAPNPPGEAKGPGPLWGPNSWNDGAGAARTYTLAGMIRYWMPYLAPGSLTDEQAQHIAAYITSQSRPSFPFKNKDYLKGRIPVDAVYYKQLYKKNPLSGR